MSGTTVMTKAYQASTTSCKVDFLLCVVGMRCEKQGSKDQEDGSVLQI